MIRRMHYDAAGVSLLVETHDAPAAAAIEALFAGWYLTPSEGTPAPECEPAIVVHSVARPIAIPPGLETFDVAGDGICHTDGHACYIAIGGSLTAFNRRGRASVDVWLDGPLPLGSTELTRIVSYALAAALRQRRRFELHSGAVIDPETGDGVMLIGPSGSGKSTLSVHLASAGWPFLTDDVLLIGRERGADDLDAITIWPLRRAFAVTAETFAASGYLRGRTTIDRLDRQIDDKRQFSPDLLFARGAASRGVPATLIFPTLIDAGVSRLSPLSASETMAQLMRMSPWACYDRVTAAAHLSTLSTLASRATGYALQAGRDLLDPDIAVRTIASCTRPAIVGCRT
jgi:energy-coupling factor transporter ATP-binding protein EcfA2